MCNELCVPMLILGLPIMLATTKDNCLTHTHLDENDREIEDHVAEEIVGTEGVDQEDHDDNVHMLANLACLVRHVLHHV